MIYKKDANFPYPLLTNLSNSYEKYGFDFDVELEENTDNYRFNLSYNIESDFINNIVRHDKAKLFLVVQSKDSKFFDLKTNDKFVDIPKSRISLSKRTVLQILIQSKDEINFENNDELNSFYTSFRKEIVVPKYSILGFSNSVVFEGSNSKPLDLFEKKVDPNIKSDIKVELGNETVIIVYKNAELQFSDSPISSMLNNPYIYMGLQKALYQFIINNQEDDADSVYINDIDPPMNGLDLKLYNLMKRKMVDEINIENIDEVIYSISDKILERYTNAIRGQMQ